MTIAISRLAPSPTGALHLGNARTFLINWALARQSKWRLLMRIEDLDGPRNKPGAIEETLDILSWLGLDFDGEVLLQSPDLEPYRAAMEALDTQNAIFACRLSRKEIEEASSAPHVDEHETHFPRNLRPPRTDTLAWRFEAADANYRLLVEDEAVVIHDEFMGEREFHPAREVGDFVVWTKRNEPSYQLAVVVDDARQGVTDVVRGDDLLASAARQKLLYRHLGLQCPRWWHLPLVLGADGRRLAKRHGDTRLSRYREMGISPERIVGLLAYYCSVQTQREELDAQGFLNAFSMDRLGSDPVTFTQEDHAWLTSGR